MKRDTDNRPITDSHLLSRGRGHGGRTWSLRVVSGHSGGAGQVTLLNSARVGPPGPLSRLAEQREVVRFAPGGHVKATPLETVALVRELAREFDDAQIARILNRQGRRSGRGLAFTKESVTSLRGKNRISIAPKPEPRDEREGPFTLDDAARELEVRPATVQRWLKEGLLAGQQSVPGAPWRIVLSEEVRRRLSGGDAPAGWVGLSEAARRLGMGKSHVAYLVKQSKRSGWGGGASPRRSGPEASSAPEGSCRRSFASSPRPS